MECTFAERDERGLLLERIRRKISGAVPLHERIKWLKTPDNKGNLDFPLYPVKKIWYNNCRQFGTYRKGMLYTVSPCVLYVYFNT